MAPPPMQFHFCVFCEVDPPFRVEASGPKGLFSFHTLRKHLEEFRRSMADRNHPDMKSHDLLDLNGKLRLRIMLAKDQRARMVQHLDMVLAGEG